MTQLRLIHTPTNRRTSIVPTTCPFTVGQTVRNTRRGETGRVLHQYVDGAGSWWVKVDTGDSVYHYGWLASLCEVA